MCYGRICAEMLSGYYLREEKSRSTFQVLAANRTVKVASFTCISPTLVDLLYHISSVLSSEADKD